MRVDSGVLLSLLLLVAGSVAFAAEECRWDPAGFPPTLEPNPARCASISSYSICFTNFGCECGVAIYIQGDFDTTPCDVECDQYGAQVSATIGNIVLQNVAYTGQASFSILAFGTVPCETSSEFAFAARCVCNDDEGNRICGNNQNVFSLIGLQCTTDCDPQNPPAGTCYHN